MLLCSSQCALREVDVRRAAQRWGREIEQGLGKPEVEVSADTAKAKKELERLDREKHTATVEVDVDGAAKAEAEIDAAGEHYMQVSKWLGHSSFVLTLTTYADYIREDELAAPKAGRGVANVVGNVVDLDRRKSDTA